MSQSYTIATETVTVGETTMSQPIRNKLSALAWGATVFCSLWLLLSAQAAVRHVECRPTTNMSHSDDLYISAAPN